MGNCTTHKVVSLRKGQKECVVLNKGIRKHITVCGDYLSAAVPPFGLEYEIVANGQTPDLFLTWEDGAGLEEMDYNVYVSIDGGAFEKHNDDLIPNRFYTIEGAGAGEYEIYVVAFTTIESEPSEILEIELDIIAFSVEDGGDLIATFVNDEFIENTTQEQGGDEIITFADTDLIEQTTTEQGSDSVDTEIL